MLIALLVPIVLATFVFSIVLIKAAVPRRAWPTGETLVLGAVVNFFDTLGIGSFAPTTAWLKFRKLVPDRLIPPTILVGLTMGAVVESIIFLFRLGVKVDPVLLVGCIIACTTGGLIGAPLVHRTRVWIVQMIVAIGLTLAAIAYGLDALAAANIHLIPGSGTASSLPIALTILAIAANFLFGVLLNYGVGNYAPTLVILSLLGMHPRLCFPIMAGAAALMGATASIRHINTGNLDLRVVMGLTIAGIPAVFVAAYLVVSMPIEYLRVLVIIVVLYAAAIMAHAAWLGHKEHKAEPATTAVAG
ncbi:MAG: TSUP family transporter [Sphingomicrobium sp.]